MDDLKNEKIQVAKQILMQLGGQEFLITTGSKDLVYDWNSLQMRLPRNASGANSLKITLGGDDLYDVVFSYHRAASYRVKDGKVVEYPEIHKEIWRYTGVYWDMLRSIFTEVTGFDTHLPRFAKGRDNN